MTGCCGSVIPAASSPARVQAASDPGSTSFHQRRLSRLPQLINWSVDRRQETDFDGSTPGGQGLPLLQRQFAGPFFTGDVLQREPPRPDLSGWKFTTRARLVGPATPDNRLAVTTSGVHFTAATAPAPSILSCAFFRAARALRGGLDHRRHVEQPQSQQYRSKTANICTPSLAANRILSGFINAFRDLNSAAVATPDSPTPQSLRCPDTRVHGPRRFDLNAVFSRRRGDCPPAFSSAGGRSTGVSTALCSKQPGRRSGLGR